MPLAKLVEKRKEFEAKQAKLMKVFKEAGDEMDFMKSTDLTGEDNKARAAEVRKMNKELEELGQEVDELVELENAERQTKDRDRIIKGQKKNDLPQPGGQQEEQKSFGRLFIESDAYKMRSQGVESELPIDMKTVFSTSAGWAPESIRTGRVVEYATRPIQVLDIIPPGQTDQAAIVYMEETTFTNAAAETTESTGAYPEAALALTERSSTVRKIAVFIPVTDEQLEDVAGIQSYLDNRLRFMLRQRLDGQVITGDGSPPNLAGILNVSGIQTFARSGEHFDAIAEAMRRIRVTGRAMPNVVIIHPTNWWSSNMRLRKTNDGVYVWGHPAEPGPVRIWGLPVLETDAITLNTSLVGDFANFCQLFERTGIEVKISDSHDTYFIYGKQAVRASVRVAFPTYRPAAFCSISNMA